jgi:drug/metabolite transporter (DMT)-like permease
LSASSPVSPKPQPARYSLANLLALLFLTLAWGGNWPVAKLGVSAMPPLWFRALGTGGGVLVLFCFARLRGINLLVPRGKRVRLVALALPNMVLWYALVSIALVTVPAGRAAILGFTMPAWVALFGLFGIGERPDRLSLVSVALSLAATALLVGGSALVLGQSLAIGLIVLAAVCWAAGTILLRRWPIEIDTTALTLWMLLTTALALFLLSAVFERSHWVMPDRAGWYAIAYNAVIVVGFGNIAWFALARQLPPVVSGLSTMMIPVVGVFSSILMVGEVPGPRDWIALTLVALALFLAVAPRPRQATIEA